VVLSVEESWRQGGEREPDLGRLRFLKNGKEKIGDDFHLGSSKGGGVVLGKKKG